MTKATHFIGIGGIGMSGLARLLLEKGEQVTGSDQQESCYTQDLQKAGATVYCGHHSENVSADARVVYTTALTQDNPEIVTAQKYQCPILHRSDLLAELIQQKDTLAVVGSHGKTTTSALLAHLLRVAGRDPSYYVGGILKDSGVNAAYGSGSQFVVELDESDGSFLKAQPNAAIVTNIEAEHLDYYKSEASLHSAFERFLDSMNKEMLVWCGDDSVLSDFSPSAFSYGLGPQCAVQGRNVNQHAWTMKFDVKGPDFEWKAIELNLVGCHNVQNALGVLTLGRLLGISEQHVRQAFLSFPGVKRRCEHKGEHNQVLVIDDYAHHPTEIRTTLNGIRRAAPGRRLIAVFQPHRYSRTRDCRGAFAAGFSAADLVIVTDIWSAGEAPIPGISAAMVLREIESRTDLPVHYSPRGTLSQYLLRIIQPQDLVVCLGAGDITQVSDEVLEGLEPAEV